MNVDATFTPKFKYHELFDSIICLHDIYKKHYTGLISSRCLPVSKLSADDILAEKHICILCISVVNVPFKVDIQWIFAVMGHSPAYKNVLLTMLRQGVIMK